MILFVLNCQVIRSIMLLSCPKPEEWLVSSSTPLLCNWSCTEGQNFPPSEIDPFSPLHYQITQRPINLQWQNWRILSWTTLQTPFCNVQLYAAHLYAILHESHYFHYQSSPPPLARLFTYVSTVQCWCYSRTFRATLSQVIPFRYLIGWSWRPLKIKRKSGSFPPPHPHTWTLISPQP